MNLNPNSEASELLAIFQTALGSSRRTCDDSGRKLWDRIEATRAALDRGGVRPEHSTPGQTERELADAVMAEINRLDRSTAETYPSDIARLRTSLLPRVYGCLNLHAIEHGFGWEFVSGQRRQTEGPLEHEPT